MRVVPNRRRRVAVSELGLGLEQFAFVNQMCGHPMSESCRAGLGTPAIPAKRRNVCDSASAVIRVVLGLGANSQSNSGE